MKKQITVKANILDKNDTIAEALNTSLTNQGVFALNLMGSPGSGKTSLLELTIEKLQDELRLAVIEGDLYTAKDADRIAKYGIPVIQINTAGGCHLDANMVNRAIADLELPNLDIIIVENVGNLVCPAEFKVGEHVKAVVLSVTEGDDKPQKYPLVFQNSQVAILNKVDLLPYTSFNMSAAVDDIANINPELRLITASCRTGEGIDDWCDWLKERLKVLRDRRKQELGGQNVYSD
ncbi:hydrogenase nickel incorporation protein HypB [Methylomusa anaerophila]|uniref:Hydrogenase isoenzymes nickel incorporation protein HypB n=1 Tax=Methylomusa anaerophila TaxID=1930071 RepID=A0A348AI84_9FIRM|nr:hydrogenase nickel incorporation protein HypB [Methylomusa anaerophila]BBB90782.1 hydrogenase isoenzymes nickel incorporation protein HypB [Methylomusa anaerophila]